MESILGIMREITQALIEVSNGLDWDKIRVQVFALYPFIQMKGDYIHEGKTISFNPNIKTSSGKHASLRIGELRKMMYELEPSKGAWYTMVVEVESTGKFKVNYDYETKPAFTYEPSREKYLAEVKEFPREEGLTPDWLLDIVNS